MVRILENGNTAIKLKCGLGICWVYLEDSSTAMILRWWIYFEMIKLWYWDDKIFVDGNIFDLSKYI